MDATLGIEFHPVEKYTIVTFGRSHLTFWNMEGGVLTRKAGVFEVSLVFFNSCIHIKNLQFFH